MVSAMTGRKRSENPIGRIVGAFVIDRPLGDRWETSEYFFFACKRRCGFEVKRSLGQWQAVAKRTHCPNCKGGH